MLIENDITKYLVEIKAVAAAEGKNFTWYQLPNKNSVSFVLSTSNTAVNTVVTNMEMATQPSVAQQKNLIKAVWQDLNFKLKEKQGKGWPSIAPIPATDMGAITLEMIEQAAANQTHQPDKVLISSTAVGSLWGEYTKVGKVPPANLKAAKAKLAIEQEEQMPKSLEALYATADWQGMEKKKQAQKDKLLEQGLHIDGTAVTAEKYVADIMAEGSPSGGSDSLLGGLSKPWSAIKYSAPEVYAPVVGTVTHHDSGTTEMTFKPAEVAEAKATLSQQEWTEKIKKTTMEKVKADFFTNDMFYQLLVKEPTEKAAPVTSAQWAKLIEEAGIAKLKKMGYSDDFIEKVKAKAAEVKDLKEAEEEKQLSLKEMKVAHWLSGGKKEQKG